MEDMEEAIEMDDMFDEHPEMMELEDGSVEVMLIAGLELFPE